MSPVLTPKPRPATARLLFVGRSSDEHLSLQRFLDDWVICSVPSCARALAALDVERPTVIVCEEELPDGSWRSLVSALHESSAPPPVIVLYQPVLHQGVSSRSADERLWAEVLRCGGFDVLACPLDPCRARQVIDYAAQRSSSGAPPLYSMRMASQGY